MKRNASLRAKRQTSPLKDTGDRLETKGFRAQSRHIPTGSREEGPAQMTGRYSSRHAN